MCPIATVGQLTTHGTPLYPGFGSLRVTIRGERVWRAIIDFHLCPIPFHVGGMVLVGNSKLLIEGFPAASKGDFVFEAGGPPNMIM
jgi:uncharacterized Zn-binding protein involved in type VI secretion